MEPLGAHRAHVMAEQHAHPGLAGLHGEESPGEHGNDKGEEDGSDKHKDGNYGLGLFDEAGNGYGIEGGVAKDEEGHWAKHRPSRQGRGLLLNGHGGSPFEVAAPLAAD